MYSGHFIATHMKDWDAPENRQVYASRSFISSPHKALTLFSGAFSSSGEQIPMLEGWSDYLTKHWP